MGTENARREPPKIIAIGAVAMTFMAGLGEWKTVNNALGALPKAFSLGVIGLAVLWFLIEPDFKAVGRAFSFLPLFLLLLMVPFFASMNVWIVDLSVFGSISRSFSKLLFQGVSILYVVFMGYLFGAKAVDYYFDAIVLTNFAIIVLEIPRFGLAASIQSVIEGVRTYGETEGFMRSLELHDLTFLFGQFLIYYLMFAPRGTKQEQHRNWRNVALSFFFIFLGFKRLELQAIGLAIAFIWFSRKIKGLRSWFLMLGIMIVALTFVYIDLIHSGWLIDFVHEHDVNMMGRDEFWTYASDYYEFSLFWHGLGFEAVDTLVHHWVAIGLITRPYPLHNDYLKVYMELGTLGLFFWGVIQYIYYPQFWLKKYSDECALLYFSLLAYMSVTYLTDNTAFYFWCSIGLRLIPMSYSYTCQRKEEKRAWIPPSARDISALTYELELEANRNV